MNSASASAAHHQRAAPEHLERLVLGVDAEDRQRVAADVGRARGEQPRLARLGVGADRDVVDRHQQLAGLDDRLQRVGELRHRLHLQRRLAVVGAEARGRVRDRRSRRPGGRPTSRAAAAASCRPRSARSSTTWRSPTTMSASPSHDRRDQLGDVAALVLVVGVGVDDHVGAELQPGVEPGLEGGGQTLVVGQADDVVDAVRPGHLDRAVGGAVVDDQPLDGVEAVEPHAGARLSVSGSCSSSLKQGIWMMSFMSSGRLPSSDRPRCSKLGA